MSLAHGSMSLAHFDRFWAPKYKGQMTSVDCLSTFLGFWKRSRNRWLPRWPNHRFLIDFGPVLGSKKRGFDMYFTVFRRLQPFCKGNPFQNRFLMILESFGTSKNVPKSIKMGGGHWETAFLLLIVLHFWIEIKFLSILIPFGTPLASAI